jgi:hypothetical protein
MSRAVHEALELLGVTASSDPASVVRAYRRLARANHPDVSTEPDAAQRFARITEAYRLVRDQAQVDTADDPHVDERTASPTEDFRRPSSPGVRRHHAPDPRLPFDEDVATSEVPAWLWSTPFGSVRHPGRPPIVAGPVMVTPPGGESSAWPFIHGDA